MKKKTKKTLANTQTVYLALVDDYGHRNYYASTSKEDLRGYGTPIRTFAFKVKLPKIVETTTPTVTVDLSEAA